MADIPATRYVKSDDVHVAYQVVGDGPLDLLWVPGFVSNMETGWHLRRLHLSFVGLARSAVLFCSTSVARECRIVARNFYTRTTHA